MSNSVQIIGNLAADPELKFTQSGDAVANFTVADTPRRFNKDSQQWEDAGETLWLRCSLWGKKAEAAAEHLRKGQRVMVTGRLAQRSYEKDGDKRTVIECKVDEVASLIAGQKAERTSTPDATDPWSQPMGGGYADDTPPF